MGLETKYKRRTAKKEEEEHSTTREVRGERKRNCALCDGARVIKPNQTKNSEDREGPGRCRHTHTQGEGRKRKLHGQGNHTWPHHARALFAFFLSSFCVCVCFGPLASCGRFLCLPCIMLLLHGPRTHEGSINNSTSFYSLPPSRLAPFLLPPPQRQELVPNVHLPLHRRC